MIRDSVKPTMCLIWWKSLAWTKRVGAQTIARLFGVILFTWDCSEIATNKLKIKERMFWFFWGSWERRIFIFGIELERSKQSKLTQLNSVKWAWWNNWVWKELTQVSQLKSNPVFQHQLEASFRRDLINYLAPEAKEFHFQSEEAKIHWWISSKDHKQ